MNQIMEMSKALMPPTGDRGNSLLQSEYDHLFDTRRELVTACEAILKALSDCPIPTQNAAPVSIAEGKCRRAIYRILTEK